MKGDRQPKIGFDFGKKSRGATRREAGAGQAASKKTEKGDACGQKWTHRGDQIHFRDSTTNKCEYSFSGVTTLTCEIMYLMLHILVINYSSGE